MPRPRKPRPEIEVGQVWESTDDRYPGRRMRVVGKTTGGRWLMQNVKTGRNSQTSAPTLWASYFLVDPDEW